jgi:16S rRNA processing protein RimM
MAPRPTSGRETRVCVAQIGAAHGLKGEVRLWSFTQDPAAVARYGLLESEDGARRFEIMQMRAAKDHFIARLAGVDERNAAEALRNVKLYVPRERLPDPDDGEFYHADLIGLAVATVTGEALGEVVAVHNFGAGDILEVRPAAGRDTIMLPFTDAAVPQIDLAAGKIVVDPPREVVADEDNSQKKAE